MNQIKELTAHIRRLAEKGYIVDYNTPNELNNALNQIEVVSELMNGKIQRITAVQFLAEKGIHSLDTKKRYDEVIKWMEEYATAQPPTINEENISDYEKWWGSLTNKQKEGIEKKYGYYGHDIGTTVEDVKYFYKQEQTTTTKNVKL